MDAISAMNRIMDKKFFEKNAIAIKREENGFSFVLASPEMELRHRITFRASTSTWSIVYDWDVYCIGKDTEDRICGLAYNCSVNDGKRGPSQMVKFYDMVMEREIGKREEERDIGLETFIQHTYSI